MVMQARLKEKPLPDSPSDEAEVTHCPYCSTGYTYDATKSLWGQRNRKLQLMRKTWKAEHPRVPMRKAKSLLTLEAPCCGHLLADTELQHMWGQACSAVRTTYGAGTGRPRSGDRCPCGAMTKARALARGHKCNPA